MKRNIRYNSKYLNGIKQIMLQHINLNLKDYLVLSILFVLGVLVGVIIINNSTEQSKNEIIGYIKSFVEVISNNQYEINMGELVKLSIINNLKMVVIVWVAGSTIIGIPLIYLITVYKGFRIGYTISAIILSLGTSKGILFAFMSLFLQNIITIPILLMLNVSALKLYRALIKENKNISIKYEIKRHTFFCLFLIIPLILASLIEAFISTNLIIMYK